MEGDVDGDGGKNSMNIDGSLFLVAQMAEPFVYLLRVFIKS